MLDADLIAVWMAKIVAKKLYKSLEIREIYARFDTGLSMMRRQTGRPIKKIAKKLYKLLEISKMAAEYYRNRLPKGRNPQINNES